MSTTYIDETQLQANKTVTSESSEILKAYLKKKRLSSDDSDYLPSTAAFLDELLLSLGEQIPTDRFSTYGLSQRSPQELDLSFNLAQQAWYPTNGLLNRAKMLAKVKQYHHALANLPVPTKTTNNALLREFVSFLGNYNRLVSELDFA